MIVEERAKQTWDNVNDPYLSGEEREAIILQALRDQIEDCAKVADDYPLKEWEDQYKWEIGRQIRALAEPEEKSRSEKGE